MHTWFVADGQPPYLDSVQNVLAALGGLKSLLTREKLLREDFVVARPKISPAEMIPIGNSEPVVIGKAEPLSSKTSSNAGACPISPNRN